MRVADLARLALRNLARNRRRTLLSLAIVAAGTAAMVLTAGFVRFSFDGLREAMIHGGLGHLEIADADAVAARPGALDREPSAAFGDWRALRDELETQPHVAAVGANLHLMGLAQTAEGRSASFVAVGVEPDREVRMGFETRVRDGEALAAAPPEPGADRALLALGLASTLGVRPGDRVTLLAQTESGTLDALDVEVAGLVTTGVAELDTRWIKLPLASAQRLAGTDRISNLLVALDDTRSTDAALERVRARLAGRPLAVTPWPERAPFYGQVRGLYLGIFVFLGAIVGVLVVLAASNTLVMAVMERVREIGTLRAIGTGRGQIAALLLVEAAWLGLFGAVAGSLLGLAGIGTINALDLHMPPPPGAVDPIDLELAVVPEAFLGAALLMIVVLLVAALLPALRAARLVIIDALGHT
ncbi:MAG: ABC transporter permease [Thermoanaerobaculia bacterium]|nr:MAG: ABC transporter permease [Thermoanaerobaculia bacterium]MBZ0103399.1 FtsX-like permease family protein [Thermoanaerobaculia bacterium]